MKYFYSYKKNDFIELTHNSVSLHERYDQISALLNKLLDKKESDILAKPTKHENKINWVNNSKELPYRLNQIDNQLRKKVLDEYWELRKSIDQKLNDLKNKKETQEWILILKKVFNEDNNILFGNDKGELVTIIWGAKFNNKGENTPQPEIKALDDFKSTSIETNNNNNANTDSKIIDLNEKLEDNDYQTIKNKKISKIDRKFTFLQSIDRGISWFSYRYWWLFLIMIITLFILIILCLIGYFSNERNCNDFSDLKNNINIIYNKLDDCCNCNNQISEIEYEEDFIDNRIQDEGGKVGELTFTLIWETKDDIDLFVKEPSGFVINFEDGHRESKTGGKLDIDRNRDSNFLTNKPIENIRWINNPPRGKYEIAVLLYKKRSNMNIPYKIKVHSRNSNKYFYGTIVNEKDLQHVTYFDYP